MRRMTASLMAIAVAATLTIEGTASARQVRSNRAAHRTHAVARSPHGSSSDSILFYGPSVGGRSINEASIAEAMGFDVTIATKDEWAAMSTSDFEAFGAIVFADPSCKTSTHRLNVAEANAETWSGAIQGPVVVTGTDPVWHLNHGVQPGPERLIANTLAYVTSGDGTGLSVGLSCYYVDARRDTPVPLLRDLGTFTVQGQGRKPLPGCPDKVETPDPTQSLLTGLTADDLSDWGCSIHEAFDSMPVGFDVVAQHRRTDMPYIVTGLVGSPYP
jgi:hypothetical protein